MAMLCCSGWDAGNVAGARVGYVGSRPSPGRRRLSIFCANIASVASVSRTFSPARSSPTVIARGEHADANPMPGGFWRSSALRIAFVLLCAVASQAEELETHWRKAKLAESGRVYWWRPSPYGEDEPEVSFTMPADAWRKGQLDDGSDYLWRLDPYGQPDVQLWRESRLESTHEPFWCTALALLALALALVLALA